MESVVEKTDAGRQVETAHATHCTRKDLHETLNLYVQNTEAGRQYAAAYATHYKTKDLQGALNLYRNIMSMYPDAIESKYSRSQIQIVVQSTVPKQDLFDAQVELALAHIKQDGPAHA